MVPLTKFQKFTMWLQEKLCRHEYDKVTVPKGWNNMQGSLVCLKCSHSLPIEVEIES